jgi:hypothetical protein
MKDRVATRTGYRKGAWNCAVIVVLSTIGAFLAGSVVFRLIWVAIGLWALVAGLLTFIKSRRADDGSRDRIVKDAGTPPIARR